MRWTWLVSRDSGVCNFYSSQFGSSQFDILMFGFCIQIDTVFSPTSHKKQPLHERREGQRPELSCPFHSRTSYFCSSSCVAKEVASG